MTCAWALGSRADYSRIRAGIREEQLLAADFVRGDRFLSLPRDEPVDEPLSEIALDVRMLLGIHQHHAVLVEQTTIAFYDDSEIATVFERKPSSAICEDVSIHR